MKVTISFWPDEEAIASSIERFCCSVLRKVRVRRSDRHAPLCHIYITTVDGAGRTKSDKPLEPVANDSEK